MGKVYSSSNYKDCHNVKVFSQGPLNLTLAFLPEGGKFINILHKRFSYQSKLSSFSLIMFGFEILWCQNIGKKVARKMLMKLTPEIRK